MSGAPSSSPESPARRALCLVMNPSLSSTAMPPAIASNAALSSRVAPLASSYRCAFTTASASCDARRSRTRASSSVKSAARFATLSTPIGPSGVSIGAATIFSTGPIARVRSYVPSSAVTPFMISVRPSIIARPVRLSAIGT